MFNEQAEVVLAMVNEYRAKAVAQGKLACHKSISYSVGPKYIRIIGNTSSQSRSAIGFVCRGTGNVYRAASWSAPGSLVPAGREIAYLARIVGE